MAVVPIVTTGQADSLVNLVVRHDMELSGQFEVLDENAAPPGPFTHTTPLDLAAWRDEGRGVRRARLLAARRRTTRRRRSSSARRT